MFENALLATRLIMLKNMILYSKAYSHKFDVQYSKVKVS